MEWVETTADSLDAAKEQALDRLGVHEDDAEFEVLNEAVTGLFGRLKQRARVRARVRPRTPPSKDGRRRKGSPKSSGKESQKSAKRHRNSQGDSGSASGNAAGARGGDKATELGGDGAAAGRGHGRSGAPKSRTGSGHRRGESKAASDRRRPMNDDDDSDRRPKVSLDEQADIAEEFVAGLAERFDAPVRFSREYVEDREIRITVSGNDLGRMVGRGGATARAIDDLVRTVLQRRVGSSRNGWIRVDVGGVRARRTEFLIKFCREQADAVKKTGVARALESMGAADRKIVHDTVSDISGVTTVSEGADPDRCVVIMPAADAE